MKALANSTEPNRARRATTAQLQQPNKFSESSQSDRRASTQKNEISEKRMKKQRYGAKIADIRSQVKREMASEKISDAELDELVAFLDNVSDRGSMNIEELDGFHSALICSPEPVSPGEYLPEVIGGDFDHEAFPSVESVQRFLDLLMKHWNSIIADLRSNGFHVPVLLLDEQEKALGNEWAEGFLWGMDMRKEGWAEIFDDEDSAEPLVPILVLAHEHDPDPRLRPFKEPVSDEVREKLIVGLALALSQIYRETAPARAREAAALREEDTYRRTAAKIGRNDPCYCGSGKKYKKCCGRAVVH